ncbi:toll/interleukin-1 receptor domain-containing protein [Thalassomonas actiniarum]|uniref:Toll/interleukin-1 receptor domain-containing protein n=1 Tax=Thalassomonas actiniarum TaxID=485447 RepID=A0AAE9YUU3_9GAMM|nr:toll/interleukin-1 receptor domain-containing protein [Thalassomonas actiniarum]WDE01536.1 toll/interleukin-1 receptor domain-containing protein [Thalassomonas actiniarum]
MKIFISHASSEQILADAWKHLLEDLGANIEAWYSDDPDPDGGIGPGKWREKIEKELQKADLIFALFTPESKNRPWIYFESAYVLGMGKNQTIIPIVYYMVKDELLSPMQDLSIFCGDDEASLTELYHRLVKKYKGTPVNPKLLKLAFEDYLTAVDRYNQSRLAQSLFHGHFHNQHTAAFLQGNWYSKWTQIAEDGSQTPFEVHPVKIWTTPERLRIVGEGKDWADHYPMEGVVSSEGYIALSYWSQGEIPICGTALLKLVGGNRIIKGTWQGYTAASLKQGLGFMAGEVVIARDQADLG